MAITSDPGSLFKVTKKFPSEQRPLLVVGHLSIDLVKYLKSSDSTPRPTELSRERVVLNCIKADDGGAV